MPPAGRRAVFDERQGQQQNVMQILSFVYKSGDMSIKSVPGDSSKEAPKSVRVL